MQLFLTVRDIFEMFRAVIPAYHAEALETGGYVHLSALSVFCSMCCCEIAYLLRFAAEGFDLARVWRC